MSVELLFALKVYALAAVISMAVAVLIKCIVLALARSRPTAHVSTAPVTAPTPPGPPAIHIAIIAAAVDTVLARHRIVHIEDRRRGTAWAAEGRAAHRASHQVPHGAGHRRD